MSMIFIPGDYDKDIVSIQDNMFVIIEYYEDENCNNNALRFDAKYRKIKVIKAITATEADDGNGETIFEEVRNNPDYAPDFAHMAYEIRTKQIAELEKENPGMHFW